MGPLEVIRDGKPVELPPSRKTRALLGYLVAGVKPRTRKHLCDLLWEGPADPRASLRWSLSKIRSLLDDPKATRLSSGRDTISCDPSAIRSDYLQVKNLHPNTLNDFSTEELKSLANLFRGDFLEDCEVPGAYRFNTWLDGQREFVAGIHHGILSKLSERSYSTPEPAVKYTRLLLQLDPYDEAAHIRLMNLWKESGEIEKALDQYNRCRKLYREELNREPSPALEKARVSLMQCASGSASVRSTSDGPSSPPIIVGRTHELKQINEVIDKASQRTSSEMVLFTGEPGIGKTHLLKAIASHIGKAGGTSLWGEAYYLEMSRPYAPWCELFENIRPNALPQSVRSRVAPLLPGNEAGPTDSDRNRLFSAVAKALKILGSDQSPLAILFDNLQWFDVPSLSLLNFVLREIRSINIFVACSARSAELEENKQAYWLIHALRKERHLRHLKLPSLSPEETGKLTASIDPELDAQKVFRESKGNPLFAVEIAYALRDGCTDMLPDSLLTLIQDRLSLLDDDTRNLLSWAAVWGHDFTLEQLVQASSISLPKILSGVEALERYNIIRPCYGDRYNFIHELVQNAAYQHLSAPRRKMIHLRIARTMMETAAPDSDRSIAIIHHAEKGGDDALLVRACLAAAQRALEVFAYKEADQFAQKGLSRLERLPESEQPGLHLDILELYLHPGMTSLRKPTLMEQLRTCVARVRKEGLNALVRKGLFLISNLYYQQGDFHSALERIVKAEEAGRSADPATMIRAVADTAKCFGMVAQKINRAETLALEAQKLAEEMDLGNSVYEIPLALALVHHHRGQYDQADQLYRQALNMIRLNDDHWWKCYVLQRFPMIELERNRPDAATERCAELLPIANKMGQGSEAPFARALSSLARYQSGDSSVAADFEWELENLRHIDSKWMIAYLQTVAAEHELKAGNLKTARSRALDAMENAAPVNRYSEKVWAAAVLIRSFCLEKDYNKAESFWADLQEELAAFPTLSSRSAQALREATQLIQSKN